MQAEAVTAWPQGQPSTTATCHDAPAERYLLLDATHCMQRSHTWVAPPPATHAHKHSNKPLHSITCGCDNTAIASQCVLPWSHAASKSYLTRPYCRHYFPTRPFQRDRCCCTQPPSSCPTKQAAHIGALPQPTPALSITRPAHALTDSCSHSGGRQPGTCSLRCAQLIAGHCVATGAWARLQC